MDMDIHLIMDIDADMSNGHVHGQRHGDEHDHGQEQKDLDVWSLYCFKIDGLVTFFYSSLQISRLL
jgi:hypothetical protein